MSDEYTLLIDDLIRDEGMKLKPYKCTANKMTIGVGRNLDEMGISREEAIVMLKNDIRRVDIELGDRLPFYFDMTQRRRDILVNMCFNLGITRFMGFKKMLEAIEAGDYQKAAIEMLDSRWSMQVGDRAGRLASKMRSGH